MDTIIQRLAMDDPAGNEFYIKRDDLRFRSAAIRCVLQKPFIRI